MLRSVGRMGWVTLVLWACFFGPAAGAGTVLPFSDRDDGISCSFYDVQLGIPWPAGRAAWLDNDDKVMGPRAHASFALSAGDARLVRRVDLTGLVKGWWSGRWPNDGLLLRAAPGAGADFHAREAADPAVRPQLLLQWPSGRRRFVEPAADATLDCSTYRGVGRTTTLTVTPDKAVAIRFELAALMQTEPAPSAAELILVRPDPQQAAQGALQVFRLQSPIRATEPALSGGLAAKYALDRGIAADPDVLFADGFEGRKPDARWAVNDEAPGTIVDADTNLRFEPLSGRALRITIPRNALLGLDMRLRLRDAKGVEPEEVYFRYYLRLARDWLGAIDGGKLPGFAATYGKAGWGGRPWDGSKGWSLRGSFGTTPPAGHAAAGRIMLGTYAYHAKSSTYGEGLAWASGDLAGLIDTDRWYCIEQRLKLNTPGGEDGVLQVWVDGRLALSRKDLRLRDIPSIRIEEVWMNFYHGGTQPAPQALHAWIDGVVIARRPIGLMQQ